MKCVRPGGSSTVRSKALEAGSGSHRRTSTMITLTPGVATRDQVSIARTAFTDTASRFAARASSPATSGAPSVRSVSSRSSSSTTRGRSRRSRGSEPVHSSSSKRRVSVRTERTNSSRDAGVSDLASAADAAAIPAAKSRPPSSSTCGS